MYKAYEKLRNERGLTDHEVALRAGIPQSTIYDWKQRSAKNKNAGMSFKNLTKIAQVLEVSILDLAE